MSLHEDYVRRARVVSVVDGDTVDLDIDLGWHLTQRIRLRLEGIDTAELRPRRDSFDDEHDRQAHITAAHAARDFTIEWTASPPPNIEKWPFLLQSTDLDHNAGSFGRSLGDLIRPSNGASLVDALIEAGHAQ